MSQVPLATRTKCIALSSLGIGAVHGQAALICGQELIGLFITPLIVVLCTSSTIPRVRTVSRLLATRGAATLSSMNKRACEHLRQDPVMAELIDRIGPIKSRPRRLPPFESLTHAIIHQQLSGKAAGSILTRFLALFGNRSFPTPTDVLILSFERLRSAGLSRPKTKYILGLAQNALDGLVPTLGECDPLTNEQLLERLTSINGVGRWTVEMLLIFNLGRPDVLPAGDLGIRKGFQIAYRKRRLPEPEQVARFGTRWAPYRTTAARYLWRAADSLNAAGGDW
jgi:DNA-3-methyladenine glycosylase II